MTRSPPRVALSVVVLAVSLACAAPGSAPKIAPGTPGPAAAPAPAAPPTAPVATAPVVEPPAPAAEPPAPAADATVCDPCLLLMEHKFGDLRTGGWCKLCGECSDPFPHAKVTCKELDELRNCIYARLGYNFKDAPKWKAVFEKEPWYVVDPTFTWDRVNAVQEYNARVLREMVSGRRCER